MKLYNQFSERNSDWYTSNLDYSNIFNVQNQMFMMLCKQYLWSIFLILLISCNPGDEVIFVSTKYGACYERYHDDDVSLGTLLDPLEQKMLDSTGCFVLEDGSGAMIARAWLTDYAEKRIDIQYFIFSLDNVGLIATDYLVRAADRGVQVRIIVDDIMVNAEIDDIQIFNAHPNISVKIYNPGVNLGKNLFQKLNKFGTDFRGANQRMHNKTFIVDGKVTITGGRNIADEYFDYDHNYNFRDRDILLFGQGVDQVQSSFDEFWDSELTINMEELVNEESNHVHINDDFDILHAYACNEENFWPEVRTRISAFPDMIKELDHSGDLVWLEEISFISDRPGKNDEKQGLGGGGATTSALISLINKSTTSIDIQTPYLITTDLGKSLFKAAVERGVEVRILTNSLASTDNVEAFSSYQSDRSNLLATGVRIFEFRPDADIRKKLITGEVQDSLEQQPIYGLHAKSMVIDGNIAVIGTFNLDPRSANLNTECIVIVESDEIATGVLRGMQEEFQPQNSWEITESFNPDNEVSKYKRVKTWSRKILPKGIL